MGTQSVTLPNGMVLARAVDWTLSGRHDLVVANGRIPVVRDVETVCFNDRYVWVQSREAGSTGLCDAAAGAKLDSLDYPDAMKASGLNGGSGCGGYYLGMVGPGLLYDGNEAPFLPTLGGTSLTKRWSIETGSTGPASKTTGAE